MKKLLFISCLILISCSVSKPRLSDEKVKKLREHVDSNKFHIVSTSARPMTSYALQQLASANLLGVGNTGNYIDLTTISNYFIINDDQLSVHLPFYGESRSIDNTNGAIKFDGVPQKSNSTFNESKKRYELNYSFKNEYDYYRVNVFIYLNGRTSISITSNKRTPISYRGIIQDI